ncbi:MAG: DUF4962 domain-containing protein [Burkholderiales bacterium]|nr:DUF4962 domain-containing protein [Burkholderiales bacterium]
MHLHAHIERIFKAVPAFCSYLPVFVLTACGSAADAGAGDKAQTKLTTPAPSSRIIAVTTYDGNLYKARFNQNCTPNQVADFISNLPQLYGNVYPEDCGISKTRAPILQWPEGYLPVNTDIAEPWSINIIKDGQPYLSVTSKYPQYQFPSTLPIGSYEWTVSYKSKNGTTPQSQTRRFYVDATAIDVASYNPTQIINAAKSAIRPRMFPRGLSKETMLANITQNASAPFAVLKAKAKTIQDKAIGAEPQKRPVNTPNPTDYSIWLVSLNSMASAAASDMNYLGYVSKLTNDASMAAAGKARLLALADWDPVNGVSNYTFQDQAARQVLLALAKGYDYFYDDLSAVEKSKVISVIKTRTEQMMPLIASHHWHKKDSHGVTNVGFLLNVLLLLAGDQNFPEAEQYLRDTYTTFLVSSTAHGGDDGAFQNGTGYGWYVATLLETMISIKSVTGYDISKHPYYSKYVDYLMAFTAPLYRQLMTPFGDDHIYTYDYQAYSVDTLQPFALLTQNAAHEWYFRANKDNLTNQNTRPVYYFNLVAMGAKPVTPVAPTQDNWFFPNAGLASLTSKFTDANGSSVAFRSSEWGAYNHSYADQNSFTLVSKGRDMLISSGYYYVYDSEHHRQTRSTRSQNALTFDGGIGQSESPSTVSPPRPTVPVYTSDAAGQLYNGGESNGIAIVTGNASKAYRRQTAGGTPATWVPLLDNAVRSIAYFKDERIIVIYDWANSSTARTWELNFHALQPFNLETSGMARVVNAPSSICITHHNFPSVMTTTDQVDIPPDKASPSQYHLRSTATAASKEMTAITVIREDCATTQVDIGVKGTLAQVMIGNKGVDFNKKVVSILTK